jgi:hypothetical protein
MAVTYDPDLPTNRDKVRFYIQDTTSGSGPLPSGANFSDQEIDGVISIEGSWERAVAGLCETLAMRYARLVETWVGPRKETLSDISKAFEARAKALRKMHGYAGGGAYSLGVTRVDGYSDDVPSDEVDATNEYGLDWQYVRPEV